MKAVSRIHHLAGQSRFSFSRRGIRLPLITLLAALAIGARADTIVSSLANPLNPALSPISFSTGSWAASSFHTDNQTWNLSSISFLISFSDSISADVRLFSDAGGQPGVSLADLTQSTSFSGPNLMTVTFTPTTSFNLDPSTTYWVALGNIATVSGMPVGVLTDNDPFSFTGVPGASMTYSATSGNVAGNPPASWFTPGAGTALLFQVDGVVVPEPGTLTLMLVGLAGFMFGRRK